MPFGNWNSLGAGNENSPWSFDVSSFLVLLGENEEVKFRHMRRSSLECFNPAPVAGLQSYLKKPDDILNSTGLEYASPYGCKKAPLRNMKLHHCLGSKGLLSDGVYTVASIPHRTKAHRAVKDACLRDFNTLLLSISCWLSIAGIIIFLCLYNPTSWIGIAGCTILSIHSIILKVSERIYSQPAEIKPGDPKSFDAIYILGHRNSCFVLEGSREDILRMTGQGVRMREGKRAIWIANTTRIVTFLVLLFTFVVIPNGTTWDQLAFIALNIVGQLNVFVGQKFNTSRFFRELDIIEYNKVATRTHVYGNLVRKFGNGSWVDKLDLLPQTDVWNIWRERIMEQPEQDPKDIYDICNAHDAGKRSRGH
jgi:hypothetical protein